MKAEEPLVRQRRPTPPTPVSPDSHEANDDAQMYGEESVSYPGVEKSASESPVKPTATTEQPKPKSSFSKVLVFVFVMLILFLVLLFLNMEDAHSEPDF